MVMGGRWCLVERARPRLIAVRTHAAIDVPEYKDESVEQASAAFGSLRKEVCYLHLHLPYSACLKRGGSPESTERDKDNVTGDCPKVTSVA